MDNFESTRRQQLSKQRAAKFCEGRVEFSNHSFVKEFWFTLGDNGKLIDAGY